MIEAENIGISYKILWIELDKRDMNRADFKKLTGISFNFLTNIGKNEYMSMKRLEQIYRKMKLTSNEGLEFKQQELKKLFHSLY